MSGQSGMPQVQTAVLRGVWPTVTRCLGLGFYPQVDSLNQVDSALDSLIQTSRKGTIMTPPALDSFPPSLRRVITVCSPRGGEPDIPVESPRLSFRSAGRGTRDIQCVGGGAQTSASPPGTLCSAAPRPSSRGRHQSRRTDRPSGHTDRPSGHWNLPSGRGDLPSSAGTAPLRVRGPPLRALERPLRERGPPVQAHGPPRRAHRSPLRALEAPLRAHGPPPGNRDRPSSAGTAHPGAGTAPPGSGTSPPAWGRPSRLTELPSGSGDRSPAPRPRLAARPLAPLDPHPAPGTAQPRPPRYHSGHLVSLGIVASDNRAQISARLGSAFPLVSPKVTEAFVSRKPPPGRPESPLLLVPRRDAFGGPRAPAARSLR